MAGGEPEVLASFFSRRRMDGMFELSLDKELEVTSSGIRLASLKALHGVGHVNMPTVFFLGDDAADWPNVSL